MSDGAVSHGGWKLLDLQDAGRPWDRAGAEVSSVPKAQPAAEGRPSPGLKRIQRTEAVGAGHEGAGLGMQSSLQGGPMLLCAPWRGLDHTVSISSSFMEVRCKQGHFHGISGLAKGVNLAPVTLPSLLVLSYLNRQEPWSFDASPVLGKPLT